MDLEAHHTDYSAEFVQVTGKRRSKLATKCSNDVSPQNVSAALHRMPLGFLVIRIRYNCLLDIFRELQAGLQLEEEKV